MNIKLFYLHHNVMGVTIFSKLFFQYNTFCSLRNCWVQLFHHGLIDWQIQHQDRRILQQQKDTKKIIFMLNRETEIILIY